MYSIYVSIPIISLSNNSIVISNYNSLGTNPDIRVYGYDAIGKSKKLDGSGSTYSINGTFRSVAAYHVIGLVYSKSDPILMKNEN